MNKRDYSEFHRLLAILKYELQMDLYDTDASSDYAKDLRKWLEEIEDIMKIFVVECE